MHGDDTKTSIPIGMLPRELRNHGVVVGYNIIWRAATDGRIPAHKVGARWYVDCADISDIASAFARTTFTAAQ